MEKIYSNDDKTKAEQSMDAAISSVTSLELTSALKISKIGVERQREYRVRQKQKISSKPKKKTKTPAERQREYRLRRKQKMLSNLKKKIKSLAERQQEYRLRQKQKLLNNPEQKKKFLEKKIEYQRQYRLKKKLEKAQKINGDKPAIKIKANYQREYRLRTKFRPQLYSSSEIPTAKPKKEAKEQMQNVIEFRKLKRVQQNPTEDHNINEIYQLKSQPIPTLHFGENRIQQISNQDLDSFEFNELMQPQDSYEGDYGEHLDTVIKGKHIDNENHFNTNEKSPAEHDSSHLIISYCSHKSVHNLFNKTFVKYSFGHVCNICAHQRCPKDVKNGKFDGENVLKQITEDNVVMKTEGQTDDVMIKQELDIGPTVLQPKTTSCMLRMQTMMEVAGSNFQQCPMRPRRCYRGPRVRREVLAERPKPVTPATHSDVKEGFVMKTEGEMDETRIKQELDIGAMVLQSKTIPYLSPPQTFVSSHAGPVSHSGSRTGQDLRPASPEIFSQSSSLIEDSVVSSGASLVLNVIGADNVLRVPRSHARGSDSEDTQEGGQCKHCVKSPTVCKCGTCGLRTEAYTQMGGKHCKYNTMEVCINNPTSNSYRKKPYECKHCEYSTSRLDNLKMHTRTHTGEKPYRCEQCEYSASQLGQLTRHMRTHLGDSPYKCEECDYSTFLLANLKTHVRTHTREDPYNCKRCGYTTFELDNFRTHVYTHVEEKIYKCEQCEYSTSRLHNLKMHRRIHTGVKPYRCERCDYSASQQGYLKRHMWTHMNKSPFKCERCEYSSFQLINLEKHMHTHVTDNHKM